MAIDSNEYERLKEVRTQRLKNVAQKRRKECLERVQQGIQKVLTEGRKITFKAVAEAAGVSEVYLYKEPLIRKQIQMLREQFNEKSAGASKAEAIDQNDVKSSLIDLLKQRGKELWEENLELQKQNAALCNQVIEVQQLQDQVKKLLQERDQLKLELAEQYRVRSAPVPQQKKEGDSQDVLDKFFDKLPDFDPTWPSNIQAQWMDSYNRLLVMADAKFSPRPTEDFDLNEILEILNHKP